MLSLYALLRSSAVQTYLTIHIADYLSKELNTTVRVSGVDIELFPGIAGVLENLYLEDLHGDTLLYANRLKFNIENIDFGGNQLKLNKIVLVNTCLSVKKYITEDHLNLQFIIDALRTDDTLKSKWVVSCNTIELFNSDFRYRNENKPLIERGLNFHDINVMHINANISNIGIIGDTILANIESMSCVEKSGFILKAFTANVKLSPVGLHLADLTVKTPFSIIKTQLSFQYSAYDDFLEFVDKVKIKSDFEKTEIGFDDIALFVPELDGLTEKVALSGLVRGNISRLKCRNIVLAFGESGRFYGDIDLTGLPYVKEAFIHLKVKEFKIKQRDLSRIPIPPFIESKYFMVPERIALLGNVKFMGEFTGFYNDFVAYGNFFTGIGRFSSDVSLKEDTLTGKVRYSGNLASDDINAGTFLNLAEYLGKTGFDVHIDGSGFTKYDVEARLKGVIKNIEFNGYNYRNVKVTGDLADRRFNGLVLVDDENITLDFNGKIDFTETPPVFDFRTTVDNANLEALNIYKKDTASYFSAQMISNLTGDNIDNMDGEIFIDNIIYRSGKEIFESGALKLIASATGGGRHLQLNSDIADAEINGSLSVKRLVSSFNKLLYNLLPSALPPTEHAAELPQNFKYSLDLKNTEMLTRIFLPEIKLSPNTHLSGTYDEEANLFVLNGSSPGMDLYDRKITKLYLDAKTENNTNGQLMLHCNTGCSHLSLTDSVWIDDFKIQTLAGNDSILFSIGWGKNKSLANRGDVNGYITPGWSVSLLPSEIAIADSVWSIKPGNKITFDSTSVSVTGFEISNDFQQIKIDGTASKDLGDDIKVMFSNIELANFNLITQKYNLDLKGTIHGDAAISGIYAEPVFSGNIDVIDLELNENKLGNASIASNWDNNTRTLQLIAGLTSGELKTIDVRGNYYLSERKDKLDFSLDIDKLKLHFFEPFVKGIFSDIRGIAKGNLKLNGNFSEPILTGQLKIQKTGFLIDYINTRYSFADEINFYENRIGFDNLILNDSKGNRAVVNGNIYHDYLKDFKFDINIDAKDLYCLNTGFLENNSYYGEVYATGLTKIKGGIKDIVIDISARTQKGSRIFIPLSGTEVVSENSFITFVHNTTDTTPSRDAIIMPSYVRKGLEGINIELEVTPDAEVQLIFDEKIGDIIKGRGNGNLKMTVDNSGDFNMFGVFIIEEGDYLFTLKNIINKRFTVEKGGSIRWEGNPYNADIKLNAIYPLRAPLYGLTLDSADRSRIPLECGLILTGKLLNPEIEFDIKLPKADENTKNIVKGLITTEQDMNKQVFSLLILGSFQPASDKTAGNSFVPGAGVGINSSEVLSNQLSNWLSQISEDFDIGVNYRPGDEITDKEVELALSTQLFDERLTINGSVANNPNAGNTSTSSIVGDFNLDYKLTEDGRIRVKAFNKSNNYTIVTDNTLYTQGVGISYRRDFDSFWDLFRKKKTKIVKTH